MPERSEVTNGGSAIGEAIGNLLEEQVHMTFREIEAHTHSHFLTRYGKTMKGKESRKLLLPDDWGNQYNIDGLLIDEAGYPLMLIESKYIRYKKHNRDKASWVCNAHSAIRKHFPSIRSSIAVLAGNWSATSLAMLASNRVSCFVIPFPVICRILGEYGIDFEWEENDKEKAMRACWDFCALSEAQKKETGRKMMDVVREDLIRFVEKVLDDAVIREAEHVTLEIRTNKGETFTYAFHTVKEAAAFLENFDNEFDESQFVSIYEHRIQK